jgi:hypothetical protein
VKIPNKTLLAITVFSVLFGLGTLWERNSFSTPSPITADCGCYCHKLHQKETKELLSKIREDRSLLLEEKSRVSEELMTKQYEECSKPFRDFLEEISHDEV